LSFRGVKVSGESIMRRTDFGEEVRNYKFHVWLFWMIVMFIFVALATAFDFDWMFAGSIAGLLGMVVSLLDRNILALTFGGRRRIAKYHAQVWFFLLVLWWFFTFLTVTICVVLFAPLSLSVLSVLTVFILGWSVVRYVPKIIKQEQTK